MFAHGAQLRVAFFPNAAALAGNPYWTILKDGLEEVGAEFVAPPDGQLLRWLYDSRHEPIILHLHYVQQFYAYELHHARLRWVLRMARNLMLARFWGHRVVFTLHNLTPTYPLAPQWVDHLGHRLAVNLADRVIVHCETARQLLAETYGRRRDVHVVPHPNYIGVYPDSVSRETARRRFGFSADDIVLAFIGGVRPNKGVDRLVRVFRQCENPRLRLLIAGQPGPRPDYIAAIQDAASADPRIQLCLEFIPDEELQCYYRAADVVVLPFDRILTSGSVMLALSLGKPVIVPRMGCLRELPDEVALKFDPTSEKALLQAIEAVQHRELAEMGNDAYRLVGEFSWKVFVNGHVQAYSSPSRAVDEMTKLR